VAAKSFRRSSSASASASADAASPSAQSHHLPIDPHPARTVGRPVEHLADHAAKGLGIGGAGDHEPPEHVGRVEGQILAARHRLPEVDAVGAERGVEHPAAGRGSDDHDRITVEEARRHETTERGREELLGLVELDPMLASPHVTR